MDYLLKTRQPVKLHGVDVRIMDEEQAWHLNKLKMKQNIHIAWDLPALDLTERLKEMVRHVKPYKITCYVLVGFNSTIEQDLFRLNVLRKLGITPFVIPFRDYENRRTLPGMSVTLHGGQTGCGCSSPLPLRTIHPAKVSSAGNI